MVGKSARLADIPQQSTQNSKFAITGIREKPVNFFCCLTRASTLVFAITLLTQVSVQKFPFLFISIIPWDIALQFWSCLALFLSRYFTLLAQACPVLREMTFSSNPTLAPDLVRVNQV